MNGAPHRAGEVDLVHLSIAVVVTLVVYWASHVYAELVGCGSAPRSGSQAVR